ncbi:unnamed protein product [Calypogeia fissa]
MLRFRDLEDSDEIPALREVKSSTSSIRTLPPLGRILGILFAAEPRELGRGLAAAQDKPGSQQSGSVGKAAVGLIQHVKGRVSGGLSLEHTYVPILEHAVKSKDSSYRKRSVILLRWLLENRDVRVAVASTFETVIGATPGNNRVKLGWCVLMREVVQGWSGQVDEDNPLHSKTLDILVACIPQLANIVFVASVKEGKKRVPTRLTIAAADCLLVITNTLAAGPPAQPDVSAQQNQQKRSLITSIDSSTDSERSDCFGVESTVDNVPSTSNSDLYSNTNRRELALWEQLDQLISLLRELEEWNDRDRPLFAKGLHCIYRRLQLLASYRDSLRTQDGGESDVSVGAAVLTACWQHYGGLLLTEDKKLSSHPEPILQHWLGALQYYLQQTEESDTDEENKKTMEMRGYALACLTLVLGRLDARRLETALQELGPELLKAMFDQLRGADDNVVDLAVAILRIILFRPSSPTSGDSMALAQMESVVPMLLEMLDKRDIASRAVVLLVAEYFAAHPESIEMEQLFSRLDSEESGHRRNALDVLTELLSICTRSVDMINSSLSQTIAKHLFKRLGDIELTNRVVASALFAKLDPSLTLPVLMEFLYSPDGRIRSAASTSVLSVLKGQVDHSKVVTELLDCATKMVKSSSAVQDHQSRGAVSRGGKSDGPIDLDRIMRLIPDWADTVEDWEKLICVVLLKMFQEPANAVIPRFLSSISNHLARHVHIIFPLVLEEMRNQSKLTQDLLSQLSAEDSKTSQEGGDLGKELFQRLSPLLVLRVLPLDAFNDRTSKELYGDGAPDTVAAECITSLLLDRVCGGFEFEDVRKVASELTGRLLPNIMIPLITAQLEDAYHTQDLLRAKACIYVLCTSLGIRGQESLNHPLMTSVCQILTSTLLWQWAQDDKGFSEVGKVQHGCIDCFAMMICAELQPQQIALSSLERSTVELSIDRTQIDLVDELSQSEVEKSLQSPKIMFVEELPESEQLKSRHLVGIEQKRLVEDISTEGQGQTRLSATKRIRPKLIEELHIRESGQETIVRGDQPTGSHPAILLPLIACLIGQHRRLPWLNQSSPQASGLIDVSHDNSAAGEGLKVVPENENVGTSPSRAFRVCMANALISACQKVAPGARTLLASRMILPLVHFVQTSTDSKLRGACLQVLFTAVYHLKAAAVLPYAIDLFDMSIAAIKSRGMLEERIAGAKLLASLLASDEALVKEMAPRLMDAQIALSSISAMDSSPELRLICENLLSCLSTPGGTL